MIGETNKAQKLIPNNVMSIWLSEPMETPSKAPVTRYAISTQKLAITTKKTIPIAFVVSIHFFGVKEKLLEPA